MDEKQAINMVNQIFVNIFGRQSPFSLEEILTKFAFDVKLPQKVLDSVSNKPTWTTCMNASKFITQEHMDKYDQSRGWMIPKQEISTLEDLLQIWKKTNYTTTERIFDCINVAECDPLYHCENAFRCTDCRDSKNIIFTDGCGDCNSLIASQRSGNCNFGLRVDDSDNCNNSYNVICSAKINNSLFIQDCNNLYECIFCSHIANKRYCIANMQFEKEEYLEIKKVIIDWIFKQELT